MKNIRGYLIASILLLLIKILAGYVCHINALYITALYELIIILFLLFSLGKNKNNAFKGIVSLVLSLLILGGAGYFIYKDVLLFMNFKKIVTPSLWGILFLVLILILRYIVECVITSRTFNRRGGVLGISPIKSNYDFYMVGIVLLSIILGNLGRIKKLQILKFFVPIGELLIVVFVVIKGIKLLVNSIKSFNNEFIIPDEYKNEISNRREVRRINELKIYNFGGIRYSNVILDINSTISMIDINSFVLTLQDYMLKISDVVEIYYGSSNNLISGAMQRRISDARNSGSRNSSSNTKKKNSRKKNKKR